MQTPYVPHLFGADALTKGRSSQHWLSVGIVSSIPWPQDDVWVEYDRHEYILYGARVDGDRQLHPSISTPILANDLEGALARTYRFTSILGYFKRGYVDVTGHISGGRPIRYSIANNSFTSLTVRGGSFNCNYLPVIDNDQTRKALAFLREGRRLRHVHEPYSFLSFFKVLESQFDARGRIAWFTENLDALTGEAGVRVADLRSKGIEVGGHLYESGRCAVAHASIDQTIVDPDVPTDRRRIAEDLDVISALADRYLKVEAGVPDELDLFATRDRVAPWHSLIEPAALSTLQRGECVQNPEDLGRLFKASLSVRLWPDTPAEQFSAMTLIPTDCRNGVIKLLAINHRETIFLVFAMDVPKGRMHTLLKEGGVSDKPELTAQDVQDYAHYFYSVMANRSVELAIEGADPIECEIVIPHNIIPCSPEEGVRRALEEFRSSRGQP